ncbi:ABC transporter permease [Colwellia sp. 75C3]|uniref:FtsX-like permease family protein n=1 Tax=Colwellia sp. 75C3 TaxID=888425 RepID=UPI000C3331B5|nr:FtsX-like permease family protein [Colwellia sp. 75C3]PKG81501.1 ABC transporter permease [Colwellia sp. 75C3]
MSITLDIKYAARLLHKKPAFTALTIFIVAIGLGLTLYTYSLLSSLVFKPLLLNKDSAVISIEAEFDPSHLSRRGVDAYDFLTIRNELDSIDEFGIYENDTALIGKPQNNAATRKYNAVQIEWNVFEFSGVKPIMGRALIAEDHFEGAEPVIVLGYDVWQQYFLADKDIVNTSILVDAVATRVVGVMPQGFAFPMTAQIWIPIAQKYLTPTDRSRSWLFSYARLKTDVSFDVFSQELALLNKTVVKSLPDNMRWRLDDFEGYLRAVPYKKASITQFYSIFITMGVVVVLILLLACINVGNLLLARVNERFKEVAIRIALGVPRHRLILQMLLESIFICSVGGFLAVLFAGWGLELSNTVFDQMFMVNQEKPFWWQVSLDTDAIILLVLSVVAMIVITGFIPAWRALSCDFNGVLRDGTRGSQGKKAARASQILVISEIFLSCVVLVIATILLSTSYSAGQADYGVDTKNRITATLELPESSYPIRSDTEFELADTLKRTAFYYDLQDVLEQMPNIEAVAFMSSLPGTGEGASFFEIEGRAAAVYNENPFSNNEVASRGAWNALGMTVIQGRDFSLDDISEEIDTIIINESIANDFFPDGDAIGQRVRRAMRNVDREGGWQTIVGVVSDTFHGSAMRTSSEQYSSYFMLDNVGFSWINMAIHYSGSQVLAEKSLQQAINQVNNNATVYHIQSYDELISQPMILVSAISKVFLLCGVIAVFLAASGIYAVAANSVSQRTQEIGVRRALGASDSKIMQLFMRKALWQLVIGLSIGITLSLWVVNQMTDTMVINQGSYLIGLLGIPLLIVIMVIVATYVPTRKVVLMEPSDALHHD